MGVVETMCQNLCQAGVDASLQTEKKGLLSQVNPLASMTAQSMGKIVLKDRHIDEIELFGHHETSTSDVGWQSRRSRLTAVDVDYIVRGNITGKKKELHARLNVKRKGVLRPTVVEISWQGSSLAARLNEDSTVKELLWQSLEQLSARDIEVKPDESKGMVKIHVRDDRQVFRGELPPFQLYERIPNISVPWLA